MYQPLKSGMACLVICALTWGGWFSWNEELTAKKPQDPLTDDALEPACNYCEGWYRFDDFVKNTGQFEARTIPEIPKANELTQVQARLSSHIRISGIRVLVRFRKKDPFAHQDASLEPGPWIELCSNQHDREATTLRPTSLSPPLHLHHRSTWNNQVIFEQQLELPEGPHELEFQLVPSPNNRWLSDSRVALGWPIAIRH
jgi:hypothetical protein